MRIEISGLDEAMERLEDLQKKAKELDGTHKIPLSDLFTPSYMRENTSYSSFDDFLAAGGFHAETNEEFEAIPDDEFDAHISSTTKFPSWDDMLADAAEAYLTKQLGL